MSRIEFAEEEILDKGSEYFQDDIHNEELLDAYYRGIITLADLSERLLYLKGFWEDRALADLTREAEEQYAVDKYGDSGVA